MKDLEHYLALLDEYLGRDYPKMLREPGGAMQHPFITPGSEQYADVLWDWDSWLSNVALRQILQKRGDASAADRVRAYERGCVLNFLDQGSKDGWIPIHFGREGPTKPAQIYTENMHKPCLAQHAAFLVQAEDGDAEWLRPRFYFLQTFLNNYRNHHRHECGLYFWQNDECIGTDNDPCTYYRPPRSSGAFFLNALMLKELEAMAFLGERLELGEVGLAFAKDAADLRAAIQEHCWDERDGFFYSVDLNLRAPERPAAFALHQGAPRSWPCLIQRIGTWSGFLSLWCGVATPEQADRIVAEHLSNGSTFNAPFGVRTLSRLEKMYDVRASGNPSSWLGPVWGVSNYMTWRGLVNYGFRDQARELANKSVRLFGRDLERFGMLHEYYQPENGEPILNPGFQNWNYLVLNMAEWLRGGESVSEWGMGGAEMSGGRRRSTGCDSRMR